MCGLEVSSTQVSNAAKRIDEELNLLKNRPLGEYSVLFVDAEYQRVRINGSVVKLCSKSVGQGRGGLEGTVGPSQLRAWSPPKKRMQKKK